jgi:hypothetical protein
MTRSFVWVVVTFGDGMREFLVATCQTTLAPKPNFIYA